MDTQELLPLDDTYTTSAEVGDLMMALAKAQAKMENPDEDSDNPFFNSRYASLGAVINAVRPSLNAEGIAVTQFGTANLRDHSYTCTTVFWLGKQFLQWRLTFPVIKMAKRGETQEARGELNKQDYAAVNTYARRIMLMGMAGVAGEPDDDGNDVVTQGKNAPRRDREQRPRKGEERVNRATGEVQEDADPRMPVLQAIVAGLTQSVRPLKHAGLYKAVLHHCFEAEHFTIKEQPLTILEAGMPLFRHLCAALDAEEWDPSVHPDEWIAQEHRTLAALARGDAPVSQEEPADEGGTGASWGPDSPDLMEDEEDEDGDREHAVGIDKAY